ncbi:MAG: hypothetical protein HYY24_06355 [Verrucomicrobia bacterium]|nr:hypothetical protein [Verrucomicrobiota bacterium]
MLKLVIAVLTIVVFWSFMTGWAVMYAFADGTGAGNVSAILLSPVALVPLPGPLPGYAVAFWSVLSLLVLFRHVAVCRYTAGGLLVVHWMGAAMMLWRDLFSDGGWARVTSALQAFPSLCVFVVAYAYAQYQLCRRLTEVSENADPTEDENVRAQLTAGKPWKW